MTPLAQSEDKYSTGEPVFDVGSCFCFEGNTRMCELHQCVAFDCCRVKANNSNLKVDLYVNGELLDQSDDRKLISQVPIRDKTVSYTQLALSPKTLVFKKWDSGCG